MGYDLYDAQYDQYVDEMYSNIEEELREELYEEHRDQAIEEFIFERMQSYYRQKPDLAENAIKFLRKSKALLEVDPTVSLIYAAISTEVLIKSVLLKPVVYGMVHNEYAAEMISSGLLKQSGIDRFKDLVFDVIDENVDLGCSINEYKRQQSSETLWRERDKIQRLRNKIMHAANECSFEDAQQAIDITVEFVSIIVAVIRNFSLDLSSEGLVIDYVDPNQQSLF
ncbi:TPA: hypothetical protein P0E34_005073 [Vibrio campbellii]|nr:hypothetical protein [Vibrio vulnificus]HDM8209815.1 hypothetical protein [Vibrio campbellii]